MKHLSSIMIFTNEHVLIINSLSQIPIGLLSYYCIPQSLQRISHNYWPSLIHIGYRLSYMLNVNLIINYITFILQIVLYVYHKEQENVKLAPLYFLTPIIYMIISVSYVVGVVRKLGRRIEPSIFEARHETNTNITLRKVSLYWLPIEISEQNEEFECNICYELYRRSFEPSYPCKCVQKSVCHRCILSHINTNRTCPWCREVIHEIHVKFM